MWRDFPPVRALSERARQALAAVLIGVGLLAPGGLLSKRIAEVRKDAQAAASRDSIQSDSARLASMPEPEVGVVPPAVAFAEQYDIPLTLAVKIHRAAVEQEIEPKVAFGLVRTESSFRRAVVSPVGAVGYTQLLPSTARWLVPGTTRRDLFDAETNLEVGFRYLRKLVDRYDGNVRLALTAYNRGPGTVDRALRRGRNPENGYADMVLTGKDSHQTGHASRWRRS